MHTKDDVTTKANHGASEKTEETFQDEKGLGKVATHIPKAILMDLRDAYREELVAHLEENGFEVTAFSSPSTALFHLERCIVDVLIWEWNPLFLRESREQKHRLDFDIGIVYEIEIARFVRKYKAAVRQGLFALVSEDEILGYRRYFVGKERFDECFYKELHPKELAYWIKNDTKMCRALALDPFVLDEENQEIKCYGTDLLLSFTEFVLFRMLLKNEGQIVSFDRLYAAVYPNEQMRRTIDVKGSIRQKVCQIRNKIERLGCKRSWIHNVRGRGYKLVLPKT